MLTYVSPLLPNKGQNAVQHTRHQAAQHLRSDPGPPTSMVKVSSNAACETLSSVHSQSPAQIFLFRKVGDVTWPLALRLEFRQVRRAPLLPLARLSVSSHGLSETWPPTSSAEV